jgi:heptosyltransferase-3
MNDAPRHILLVCPQRIGDVLLATPIARSIKRAWPNAMIDMLVFVGTEGALEGNTDLRDVIVVPRRAGIGARLRELTRLWRHYDVALSPIATDRARIYCWAAGKQSLGMLLPQAKDRAKSLLLNQHLPFDDLDTHTVNMGLALTSLMRIEPSYEVVPPCAAPEALVALKRRLHSLDGEAFAVLHPFPKFRYKMWTPRGWIALVEALRARGLGVVFTGSAEPAEIAYVTAIAEAVARASTKGVLDLSGSLSLAETAALIRMAVIYIGPDTAVTHIAAATGTPTVALFGPSNPVKWGPWPQQWAGERSPWARVGGGRQGNVFLVQGTARCAPGVPCML